MSKIESTFNSELYNTLSFANFIQTYEKDEIETHFLSKICKFFGVRDRLTSTYLLEKHHIYKWLYYSMYPSSFLDWQKQTFDNIVFKIINDIFDPLCKDRYEICFNQANIRFIESENFVKPPSWTIYDRYSNKVMRGFCIFDIIYYIKVNGCLFKTSDRDQNIIDSNNDINSSIIVITGDKYDVKKNIGTSYSILHQGFKNDIIMYFDSNILMKKIKNFFEI